MRTKVILSVILFIAINCFLLTGKTFSQWQPEIRMTNEPLLSYTSFGNARCIAANGDVVHAVWYSGDTVAATGIWDIFYKRSTDKGVTWSEAVNLSNSGIVAFNPAIAVSGNYVHVVWYERFSEGNYEEYYTRSTDGGITWETKVRLTYAPNSSAHGSIAASGSNVHFVWMDYRTNTFEIYYKKSLDAGVTWSEDLLLSNTGGKSYMPTVAVSGSTVHVAWCDSTTGNWKVYYKLSADNGITWGADTQLSSNSFISKYVTLAASGSNVHLVWTDIRVSSTGYLYYKRSINGGISWGAETKLTKNTFSNAYPSLAVNGSVLHLTFMRLIKSSWEIFYISSSNNGTKWGSDVQLTNNASYSSVPSIAVSGSNVHIIFRDDRDGNYEIYYKRYIGAFNFKPTGITDNDPELLSVYSLSQNYPNPFNPVTNINFQLPADNFTTMIIYDIAGRVVETLVNNNLQAGTYQVSWNGSKYSSGVYFYRLTSGEFSDIKSLILLK